MRLNRMTLRGFGSYRDEVAVDLTGLTFTGVVGPNYSGKSTLIFDALGFALFAWTRQDLNTAEVITRGESTAQVIVDFTLGGQDYRVSRIITRSGRHEAVLYQRDDSDESGWRALSEKHPGETNKAIADLLGMGSTSALATWMVQQNDFDALLSAKPSARRDILVEVFDLGRFGTYAKSADARRKNATTTRREAATTVATLDGVLADLDAADAASPAASFTDKELDKHGKDLARQIKDLGKAMAGADNLDSLTQAVAQARQAAQAQAATEQAARDSLAAATARTRATAQAAVTQATRALDSAKANAERAAAESKAAAQRVEDIAMAAFDLAPSRTRAAEAAETVTTRESEVEALGVAISSAEAALAGLDTQIAATRTSMTKEKARADQIAVTVREGDGECFTCHQPLSPEAANRLAADQQALLEQISAEGRAMSAQRDVDAAAIAETKRRRADAQRILTEARARATEADRRVALIEQQIAGQDAAEAESKEATARAAAAAQAVHDAAADLEVAREDATKAVNDAEAAEAAAVGDSETLVRLRKAAADAEQTLADAKAAAGGEDTAALSARLADLERQQQSLWGEVARRKQVAEQRESATSRREEAVKALESAEAEEAEWSLLYRAFSPSGIPARILADIVTEVSEATNDVLESLGAEFQVEISTLRAAKKKGASDKEEVNFTVITPDGEAKYASLSGAEKFMVALSVRVALAQCLARRTGRPIETMVLDEGWGNLDPEHRTAMMNVLAHLAQQFAIFAITHVDDVKDGFSSLIEVSKESGTSLVEVQSIA